MVERASHRTLLGAIAGQDVLIAQQALNAEGFPVGTADGVYGPNTANAVSEFQQKHGLAVDGIVGPETWQALTATKSGEPLARYTLSRRLHGATSGDDVREVQAALREAGFSPGPIDAIYGPMTSKAVDGFQAANGLPQTRIVDAATWEAIRGSRRIDVGDLGEKRERLLRTASATRARRSAQARSGAYVPGFSADSTNGDDLIGVQDRVDFVASVLASKQLETPLAIGLFGDWGSGKSFFMRRLQDRIAKLADHSARAESEARESYYWTQVGQIDFNAWLYSGGDIWPSFAAQVFRGVSGADPGVPRNAKLAAYQDRLEADVQEIVERRDGAESAEAAIVSRIADVDADRAHKRAALTKEADALGPQAAKAAQAIAQATEGVSSLRMFVRTSRALRPGDVARTALPLVVAAAIAIAAIRGWSNFGVIAAIVAVALAVISAFSRGARYLANTTRLQLEIRQTEEQRAALQREREQRGLERQRAAEDLAAHHALPLVRRYAIDQAARWTGREQLGVIAEIRQRFEELSQMISDADVPMDRVIVYIDDLDRCRARVVVGVLETIKLLLNLPHFVVVVGVDSRWLFRSLDVHFSQELGGSEHGSDQSTGATPQNYLEKIFQYSIVLRPLAREGFSRLLDNLLADDGLEVPRTEQASASRSGEPAPFTPEQPAAPSEASNPQHPQAAATQAPPRPSVADGIEDDADDLDLTPSDLVISREEITFMKTLAPLFTNLLTQPWVVSPSW